MDRQKLRYFLSVYQTSSPSYVLMAGIDQCMEWTASHLAEFDAFGERLDRFRDRIQNLQAVKLLEVPGMDRSKILLSAAGRGVTGQDLAELLRKRWKIEMEMAGAPMPVPLPRWLTGKKTMSVCRGVGRTGPDTGSLSGTKAERTGNGYGDPYRTDLQDCSGISERNL